MYSPIAVGGVGGSGTRVVAEILKRIGIYMGSDLNPSNDNLWFTLLFKRPGWFIKESQNNGYGIFKGLSIFEKAMTGQLKPKIRESFFVTQAAIEMSIKGHDHLHSGRGMWPIKRAINILNSRSINLSGYIGWGWKEPNTHIYIEYLYRYFNNLRYIHVIRNGLDMAYSNNQAQLFNWGSLFGVNTDSSIPLPKASLQYWIKANKRAIDLGQRLLGRRFLLLNFERLCLKPVHEINCLLDFLEVDKDNIDLVSLAAVPKRPKSLGRYRKHDTSIFSHDEIESVKDLGFEVD